MKNKWILEHPEEWNAYQRKYRKEKPLMQRISNMKSYALYKKDWYQKARLKGQIQAKGYVQQAIKNGTLPSLKENIVICSYCPTRADRYDHRDYNKPLDVQPVCATCNVKLGPAISLIKEEL